MSYDLVVFEKKKAPAVPAEFLKWYAEQAEWSEDYDYNDIAHTSDSLQKFFLAVKDIFPPMNGSFAITDEELNENPKIEERLCDYSIGPNMIYLSFGYSMAEAAYRIVKRAAYFTGVGFFATEGNAPYFFDSDYPMLLEGQWFRGMEVSDFDSIKEKLNKMTVKNRSFLCLTEQIGSYIQIGGYGDSFTIEKRVYTGIMTYTHEKAEYSTVVAAEESDADSYVMICGNRVKVKHSQVLSVDTAEKLFQEFFQGTKDSDSVKWVDMEI